MLPPTDASLSAEITRRLVARLETSPEFLAFVLRRYRDAQGFDDARLAAKIGARVDDLPRIAICRRPRHDSDDPAHFRQDVESIAEEFGLDPRQLAEVVRFVDVLDAFSSAPAGKVSTGLLAAAKERAAEERADYDIEPTDDEEPEPDDRDPGDDR
jgi:hypothetical protein